MVAVGGCATYTARPLTADQNLTRLEARRLDEPGLIRFLAAEPEAERHAGWDLARLVLAAYYFSPELDVAQAKWVETRGGVVTAGQLPNPQVGLTTVFDTTKLTPSPWVLSAAFSLTLEIAGKRGLREARAEALAEASRLDVAGAAWRIRGAVHRALAALANALDDARLLREKATLEARVLATLEAEQAAGAVSAFVVSAARISAEATRLQQVQAEEAIAVARVDLAEAIGVAPAALEGVEPVFTDLETVPDEDALAGARRQTLLNHPELLAALARYAAADADLRLQVALQYPDLRVGPSYSFNQGDNQWGIGLSVTLPIFNQNQGPIAEAEARRTRIGAEFDALQLRVLAAIERAISQLNSAEMALTQQDDLQRELEARAETAAAMVAAGELAPLELDGQRLELATAALARAQAVGRVRLALVALEDALASPAGLPRSLWRVSDPGQAVEGKRG